MFAAKRILWGSIFRRVMNSTFYGQFAAGENVAEVKATAEALRAAGISSMLCIPIETSPGLKQLEISERLVLISK